MASLPKLKVFERTSVRRAVGKESLIVKRPFCVIFSSFCFGCQICVLMMFAASEKKSIVTVSVFSPKKMPNPLEISLSSFSSKVLSRFGIFCPVSSVFFMRET